MRTATLGSVPCLPCDIGTVLSRQPITLSGARLRELVKTQPKFRELEDRGTVCGAAIRIARRVNQNERWAALTMHAKLTNSLPS
jgi:hypothetical protein